MIQSRFGQEIRYSQDCEALSEAIFEATGQRLGTTTLKRMYGFTTMKVKPRASTMDILAQYLGYGGDIRAIAALADDTRISEFTDVEGISFDRLEEGSCLRIGYSPDRIILMTYLGEQRFIINESKNSKLAKDDIIKVAAINKGFEFIASQVIRNGIDLGAYISAKEGGITEIRVLPGQHAEADI